MTITIFEYDETLCQREGNNCKRRNRCVRYNRVQGHNDWVADYWQEFGKWCGYYVPIKEKRNAETLGVRKGPERED